eukprot:c23710_g1_i3 orf=11-1576(-)
MSAEVSQADNILQTTQDFLASMPFPSMSQGMSLLKSLEAVPYHADNAGIIKQCVSLISSKASSCSNISTPTCFSPESAHSSNEMSASDSHSYACLYEDIVHLSVQMVEKLVTEMISHHVDNKFLAKCLLHYLQNAKKRASSNDSGRNTWSVTDMVPLETFERVVSLFHKLKRGCMSCRSLFGLQRMATKLHASKACRKKIEEMIGFQLDKATLDNILVSRRHHDGSVYDVNLILRIVKTFLRTQADAHSVLESGPLKKVGSLLDKYLAEIAPDPGLTGAKFKAVADSLPEFARDSHDDLYRALDIYLEAHPRVQEEEATELCKVIDFNKLSTETSMHVAQSLRFPARVTLRVLLQEQANLKAAMGHHHQHRNARETGDVSDSSPSTISSFLKRLGSNVGYNQTLDYRHENNVISAQLSSPSTIAGNSTRSKSSKSSFTWDGGSLHSHSNGSSRRSLYDQMTLDLPEVGEQDLEYHLILQQNEELRRHLHLMQSRVLELEKACGQMRSKVTKYMKTKQHILC